MKNSEECEFKGLTFDEHQVAMRKGPQSLTGLRPTCLSKVSFEYLNGGLNFGKYRLRHRCVLSSFRRRGIIPFIPLRTVSKTDPEESVS